MLGRSEGFSKGVWSVGVWSVYSDEYEGLNDGCGHSVAG